MIKGLIDVFVDDSPFNVYKCLESGVPALLLDTEYNQNDDPFLRIYSLILLTFTIFVAIIRVPN